jgi:NaMN:DMB phosphoribosyltransferase
LTRAASATINPERFQRPMKFRDAISEQAKSYLVFGDIELLGLCSEQAIQEEGSRSTKTGTTTDAVQEIFPEKFNNPISVCQASVSFAAKAFQVTIKRERGSRIAGAGRYHRPGTSPAAIESET